METLLRWQWESLRGSWRPASLLAGAAALGAAVLPPAASLRVTVFLAVIWALRECCRETRRVRQAGLLERLALTPAGASLALAAILGTRALALLLLVAPATGVAWGAARPAPAPAPPGPLVALAAFVQGPVAAEAGIAGAALSAGAAGVTVALAVDHPAARRAALLGAAGFLGAALTPPPAGPPWTGGARTFAPPGPLEARGAPVPGAADRPDGRWAVRNLLGGAASAGLIALAGRRLRPQRP